jgi:tetratricopeptide (TPR) repeat protein
MHLGEYDAAFDSLSKSLERMILSLRASGNFPVQEDPSNPNAVNEPPEDPFVADAMSKMVDSLFSKLSQVKATYSRRRLAMLYTDNDRFDLQSIDGPRLTSLQIERKAIEIARDVLTLRAKILKLPDLKPQSSNEQSFSLDFQNGSSNCIPPWHRLMDYVLDLSKLGKLCFRRCDYSDAMKCWKESYSLLIQNDDPDSLVFDDLHYQSRSLQEAANKQSQIRVNILSELSYLMGVCSSRRGENETAVTHFERSLNLLEQKRKLLSDCFQTKSSEDEWDILDLDVGYCEHALGLVNFYSNKHTPATSHYREALRIFETVATRRKGRQKGEHIRAGQDEDDSLDDDSEQRELRQESQNVEEKKNDLDVAINAAIASVMLSLGTLYHDQQKGDRARRFLEGAIQIVHSATSKILRMERDSHRGTPSITGFSDMSLVVSIVRVGDAHRRIALMNLENKNEEEARLAFETAMKYLESTNLEARLTLSIDDEKHLETINQSEINDMLMSCYEHMMAMLDTSKEVQEQNSSKTRGWFGFGEKPQKENPDLLPGTGLTREDLLFRLGNLHAKRNQYDTAIRCFMESKHFTEERLGTSEHNIIGNILFNLGNIYKKIYSAQRDKADQKAKEKAIEAYDESLRIARLVSGPDAMAVAEVMESLAALLMEDDDPENFPDRAHDDEEEATKLMREAVSIRKKHHSEMSLAFGQSMYYLGLLCLRQQTREEMKNFGRRSSTSRLDEAIACFSQALRVRKVLLGDHLEVASTSHYLGLALYKRAAATSPVKRMNPMMADALKNLNDSLFVRALFLERSERDGIANKGNEQSVWKKELDGTTDMRSVVIGSVESLCDIALLHEAQGNYEIERARLHDALTLMETWTGSSTTSEWGRESKAALQIAVSEKNAWRAKVYHSLGVSWFEIGDYEKAASDLEESLRYRGLDILETETSDEVFDNFFRQKNPKGRVSSPLPNAITMEKLALSYDKLGRFDDALRCYAFALRVYGEHHSDESLKVSDVLKRIGKVYQDRHDYKRCVRALQRALHIRDMYDEEDAIPQVEDALVFVQLARALMALGAYDQVALEHFYSAVGILEDVNHFLSKNEPQQPAMVPRAISGGLKPKEAERETNELLLECHSSILVLIRRHGTDIPDDEERVCEVLHRIGNAQAALGQYEKALKSLINVLQFQRRVKGNDHLSVADLLFNLGNIYVEISQIDRARECHQECHDITSEVLGKDSIELAENMICLGNIEFLTNNFPLALEWFDDALRLLRNKQEYEVAIGKVLQRKAVAHDKLGDYDQAIDCFGEVLKLGHRLWGVNHIELSNALNSLGNVHRNRGELRRGLRCYEESLRIRLLVGDKLSVANAKSNIGAIFTSMGQISRARNYYADALRIKTEELGDKHIETSRTL